MKGVYPRTKEMMTGKYPRTEKHKGINHHNWKGDEAGYYALHKWVQSRLGKPNKCERCGITEGIRFEWANKSGEYLRQLDDWERLCVLCHHVKDGHTDKGWVTRKKRYGLWGRKNLPIRDVDGQFVKGRPKLTTTP